MDKTSFIDSDTQKQINAPLNGTLIHGTHRMCDLIPAMLEAIKDTAEYAQLSTHLPSVVTDPSASEWDNRWQDEDVSYLYEELTDILERYTPEGYYFGTHPGDGSDFGYWHDESYMLGVITESVKENEPILLNEDQVLVYTMFTGEQKFVNAHCLEKRDGDVMVGESAHMVNINSLDEDSVQKLFETIKTTMEKNCTAKLQLLQERYNAFMTEHGEEPLYAEVTIRFKDDGTSHEDIIKLSDDIDERDDDKVFFNVTGLNDLKGLINPDNGEDFYIVNVQNITFQPKSLFLNDEKAMTVEKVQEKAVKLFGNNFEFDYWNETEAGTKIDCIDLGEMPDTISIDKLEIKDGQLSLYSNDIASDVDLQALDDIELSKVDVSLDEIKSFLDVKTLLTGVNDKLRNLLPDYGDHIFINEDFTIQRPDKNIRVVNVTHSLLVDTNEDIFVCGTTNGGFRLESLTSDELQKLNNILNEKKYNIFLSSNKEKDLVNRYQAAGMGNGTQLWPDRGTLGAYQAYAFKDNKILVFKDADDNKGVLLSSLPHEEQERLMDAIGTLLDRHITSKELADAKAKLIKDLDSARADLGDTILIQPTTVKLAGIDTTVKAIFLAPDSKGGGEFRLAGEDYAVLAVGEGKHTEFNIEKILDAVASINGLAKAVHEAHVNHLEQVAKQAIHDRIVTPSARRFTPDQVEILNRYHQVAAPDKPAGEVFKELLHEVAQEPDVSRKPEKWVTDTAKELDEIAEGITRGQSQGLKR